MKKRKGKDEFDQIAELMDKSLAFYKKQPPIVQRFILNGGWIAIQFWFIRAPLTWYLVGILPDSINLIIHTVPDYILADFTAGLLLAVAGFFVGEYIIWRPKDEV